MPRSPSCVPAAEARGIELISGSDTHANLITGDPDRLQQVFWNLLSNAIKFTPANGRVEIRLERADPFCAHHCQRHGARHSGGIFAPCV
jgi:signal transduction histidine kinase